MKADERLEAIWCIDSETGEQILVDLHTNEIIAKKNEKGEITDADKGH
jgi:hypothetical protein